MSVTRPALRAGARLLLVFAVLLALLASVHVPAHAAIDSDAEREFAALVNIERAKRGLHALAVRSDLRSVARDHSIRMAKASRLHHNPNLASDVKNWARLAENVGRGPSVATLHRALMDSAGHRRNILDEGVTEIGIGVEVRGSTVWVTQVFRRPSSAVKLLPPTTTRFGDVSSTHPEAKAIVSIANRGLTSGCSPARYCPATTLTRAQAATLLVRALNVPATSASGTFRDVSGPHAKNIEALHAAGLTVGCDTGRFCPNSRMTRAQLASFVARAFELPRTSSPFSDGGIHDGSIGAVVRAGFATGCTSTRFCSSDPADRGQTAGVLDRATR
jgi:hypothetical protein